MRTLGLLEVVGISCILLFAIQNYGFTLIASVIMYLTRMELFGKAFSIMTFIGNAIILYLIVSVLGTTVLTIYGHEQSVGWMVFYAAVCSLFILGVAVQGIIKKSSQPDGAYQEEWLLFGTRLQITLDLIKSALAIPFFIFTLFFPVLITNPATDGLFRLVLWIASIPYVGWLIGVAGILFALSFLWSGLIGILGLAVGTKEAIRPS